MSAVMDDRVARVLRLIVEDYVTTAEPVGSRTISKKMGQSLSPATIRNIMADLEEAGFLYQPHTSAGRIPTGEGFRYYINNLLARRALPRAERDQLDRLTGGESLTDADAAVRHASRLLSRLSRQACVVVLSGLSQQPLRSLSLLRASADRLLLVAVLQGGWIQHRLIEGEADLGADDLETINGYLNDLAAGLSLPQLRDRILREMKREKAMVDRLLRRALSLGSRLLDDAIPGEVYVEGRANILEQPEFADDVEKLKRILRAFEEKHTIVRLLDRAMDSDAIQISIGAENPVEGLSDLSVVASGVRQGESPMGSIGVVGPVRMDYSRVIPLVEHTARILSTVLESR